MKKIGFVIFAIALIVGVVFSNLFSVGSAGNLVNISFQKGVKGSGNVVTENREISGFHSIEVGGVFNVEIVAQQDYSVSIEADDNLMPLIKTEVNNGVLEISNDKSMKSSQKINIKISAPDLERLETSGASKVSLVNLKNSEFLLETSGASKVTVAGETNKFVVDVSGASKIDAEGLKSTDANVQASGASKVMVNVSGSLAADCSGASSVIYSGTPSNIDKKTSGVSKVEAQ